MSAVRGGAEDRRSGYDARTNTITESGFGRGPGGSGAPGLDPSILDGSTVRVSWRYLTYERLPFNDRTREHLDLDPIRARSARPSPAR